MKRRLGFLLVLAIAMVFAAGVAPAHATFPGTNGLIAFGSDRFGGTHNIFEMTSDGTVTRQLTFIASPNDGAALRAAWSPDGSKLVFEQRNADQSVRQIFMIGADGSHEHVLVADQPPFDDFFPSFSPDGRLVIFSRCRFDLEACAIYTIKTDGRGLTAVTSLSQNVKNNVVDFKPRYSPDGKLISFDSNNRGGVIGAIYVANSRGAGVHRITPTDYEAFDGDWAPSGTRLAFSTNCCRNAPSNDLWSVSPDGSNLVQLTSGFHDFSPSYSPQGDQIAFERDDFDTGSDSILLMTSAGGTPVTIQTDAFLPSWGPSN